MASTGDAQEKGGFEIYDLDALAEADDKAQECRYFLSLIEKEKDWNHFRWLTSAFLGAAYSYFEIQALRAFFNFWHPAYTEHIVGPLEGSLESIMRDFKQNLYLLSPATPDGSQFIEFLSRYSNQVEAFKRAAANETGTV